ncbi:MAG: NADH-quinone oxidoreductase subunit J [Ardenticatenaceae bacterium]|nr:NADH-quinone oxidoreductase subunit J [Ardenticatenaceae bacterium]MCB9445332.1 NADH-quinone oxidoreductase subunit J [Ardenticatenaceae bacterium]
MNVTFYLSAIVAVAATVMVITRRNAVHALLYLIVSLLAVGLVFFTLGAPFAAALEVITYAGAIMVLFLFVIMLLNPQTSDARQPFPIQWRGPGLLAAVLLVELIYLLARGGQAVGETAVSPQQVGLTLFGPYLLGVELASMLLLAGLVGAYHLGRRGTIED